MNSSAELRVLPDTTYILPILGVRVKEVETTIEKLGKLWRNGKVKLYYSPFSLLEALGKIAKLNYDTATLLLGLKIIEEEFEKATPTPEGYLKALELKRAGFPDLIDLLLYETSLTRRILLLTRDENLLTFLEKRGENLSYILLEKEFLCEKI
ncbi:MAG: PIN domain-containing protein [Thermofilaceae archaeon]|nr:PIN domain-containing protein [Thermofilaceae archaeon]MCX8180435.1 PIN domain-containing protein [Thermofilaceae archaeon]MDW8003368.1 PIN domain-containing protein [Thermofilaceae archaeon]